MRIGQLNPNARMSGLLLQLKEQERQYNHIFDLGDKMDSFSTEFGFERNELFSKDEAELLSKAEQVIRKATERAYSEAHQTALKISKRR